VRGRDFFEISLLIRFLYYASFDYLMQSHNKSKGWFYSVRSWFKHNFRFDVVAFVCFLVLVFVLFQPFAGVRVGSASFSSGVPRQVDMVKNLILNPGQVDVAGFGVNKVLFVFMLVVLVLATVSFLLSNVNVEHNFFGKVGAVLSLVYAGLNYVNVSDINSSLGFLSAFGGATFSVAGILAIVVGVVYFVFQKVRVV
jgi:hypothetical protein